MENFCFLLFHRSNKGEKKMQEKICKIEYYRHQADEVANVCELLEKNGYVCVKSYENEQRFVLITKKVVPKVSNEKEKML